MVCSITISYIKTKQYKCALKAWRRNYLDYRPDCVPHIQPGNTTSHAYSVYQCDTRHRSSGFVARFWTEGSSEPSQPGRAAWRVFWFSWSQWRGQVHHN